MAKPPHLCACGRAIPHGERCPCQILATRERKARHDARRPNARQRGYNHEWEKARREYLALHPYCAMPGCGKPANVVDHITPHKGDKALFWSRANWQPLCKPCHDRHKQRQEKLNSSPEVDRPEYTRHYRADRRDLHSFHDVAFLDVLSDHPEEPGCEQQRYYEDPCRITAVSTVIRFATPHQNHLEYNRGALLAADDFSRNCERGVSHNPILSEGTGAGSTAQETPEITFSEEAENA